MVSLLPGPAASIIKPMMLLPFTFSPSFSTKMSQEKRLAVLTNMAAGRAWMPNLLATRKSLVMLESLPDNFLALILPCQYKYLRHRLFANEISCFTRVLLSRGVKRG